MAKKKGPLDLTPDLAQLCHDLKVDKTVFRPAFWAPTTVPQPWKDHVKTMWPTDSTAPNFDRCIDKVNSTLQRMVPDQSWGKVLEGWKKAVLLSTEVVRDTMIAEIPIIGAENLPLIPDFRIGHGGLLLVERQERDKVSYVLHVCILQRSEIFRAKDDYCKMSSRKYGKCKVSVVEKSAGRDEFLAERWVVDASTSMAVDGNFFFSMCESTTSGRAHIALEQRTFRKYVLECCCRCPSVLGELHLRAPH